MGIQYSKSEDDRLKSTGEVGQKVLSLSGQIPEEEILRLKNLGFIQNKGTDCFNCNVVTRSGVLDVEELKTVTWIAQEYGNGEVAFTTGATVEILGIPYRYVAAVISVCKERQLEIGGTGDKVRPVVSCQGETCPYGVIDSQFLAEKIQQLFYRRLANKELPNKFEMAVSGCPKDCNSANSYDLAIVGVKIPQYDATLCKGCDGCIIEDICPTGAAKVDDGMLKIIGHQCDQCGICINRCTFHAIKENSIGYQVYIGGRRGKLPRKGRSFLNIITNEEILLSVIDRLIDIYQTEGESGEWFCDTVDRLGVKVIEERVLN